MLTVAAPNNLLVEWNKLASYIYIDIYIHAVAVYLFILKRLVWEVDYKDDMHARLRCKRCLRNLNHMHRTACVDL